MKILRENVSEFDQEGYDTDDQIYERFASIGVSSAKPGNLQMNDDGINFRFYKVNNLYRTSN